MRLLVFAAVALTGLLLGCKTSTQPKPAPPPVVIGSDNAGSLHAVVESELTGVQGIAWQADSGAALLYTTTGIFSLGRAAGEQVTPLTGTPGPQERILAVSGTTRLYLSQPDTGRFFLHDINSNDVVNTIMAPGPFAAATLNADGSSVVLSRLDAIAADVYALPSGHLDKELTGFQTAAPVYSVRFAPDGRSLIWLARAQVQIMDSATGQLGPAFRHEDFVSGLALTHDGSTLLTGAGEALFVWDARGGALQTTLSQGGIVTAVALSPDDRLVAVGTTAGLNFWDVASRTQVASVAGNVRQIAFAPDGSAVLTVAEDGTVDIYQP